ncbi:hypothetical protein GE21DRAFT_1050705 [Neurospora crassa]|nr:hypothetical protein GE21DRAFT_1050705 [Neurospora crassa]
MIKSKYLSQTCCLCLPTGMPIPCMHATYLIQNAVDRKICKKKKKKKKGATVDASHIPKILHRGYSPRRCRYAVMMFPSANLGDSYVGKKERKRSRKQR